MRIIAGTHRGRRLRGPEGEGLRPTSDRVREALFSLLGNRLLHSRFLDLYAGTGAVAVEAVSRGAAHATCVESNAWAARLIRENIVDCRMDRHITIRFDTVRRFLSRPDRWEGPYDLVFADPPYIFVKELTLLLENPLADRLFASDSRLILEHAEKTMLPPHLGPTTFLRRYRYGDTALSLYAFSGTAQP